MNNNRRRFVPACDFVVSEMVYFPEVDPDTRQVRYVKGYVHAVLDARFVRDRGNTVNMVVIRRDVAYPTHSNLVRKTPGGL